MLAHIARWHESGRERLTELVAGRPVPPLDPDQLNAGWAEADRGIGRAEAERRCLDSLARLRESIAKVPAGRWNQRLIQQVEWDTWGHYEEHRAWLERDG